MYKKANLFLCIILNFTQALEIFTGICYNKFNYKILNGGIIMKNFVKAVGFISISLGVFYFSFRLTDKYLNKFRRNYITIENEHVNV